MEMQKNVEEFVAGRLEEGSEETSMTDFLAEVSLATDQDEKDTSKDRVTLMTVHAAKGLEFRNVMVVGVEEELFPSAMACDSLQSIEEERRLLYVAITRAKEFCMLSYASSRYRNGQTMVTRPSRFLRDIDPQYLKMVQGSDYDDAPRGVNPLDRYRESFHSSSAGSMFNPKAAPAYSDLKGKSGTASSNWLNRTGLPQRDAAAKPSGGFGNAGSSAAMPDGDFTLHQASELYGGQKIHHQRFGRGTIEDVDDAPSGAKITVTFAGADRKTLLLRFAKFKILS